MSTTQDSPDQSSRRADEPSLEAVSKFVALCIVVVYVSGFLITSLHDFRYGFSDMNPLRPRVLAAGGWFFLFLAVPIQLVRGLTEHPLWKQTTGKWFRAASLVLAYYFSTYFVTWAASAVLVFDTEAPDAHAYWWLASIVIFSSVCAIAIDIYLTTRMKRQPIAISLVLFGFVLWTGFDSLFIKHTFIYGATVFWMLAVGGVAFIEMDVRSWRPRIGNWPSSVVTYLAILTVFATTYYPHIKASYGGGAAIPTEITLTKDFPPMPNQTIGCMLIDETDTGFYVIGKDEKHATFIPRSVVMLIHFADASESSIFSPKTK